MYRTDRGFANKIKMRVYKKMKNEWFRKKWWVFGEGDSVYGYGYWKMLVCRLRGHGKTLRGASSFLIDAYDWCGTCGERYED